MLSNVKSVFSFYLFLASGNFSILMDSFAYIMFDVVQIELPVL